MYIFYAEIYNKETASRSMYHTLYEGGLQLLQLAVTLFGLPCDLVSADVSDWLVCLRRTLG